jgi:uncharacterized protein
MSGASPLGNFGGTARLFPLPNLVLFPHVVQPLHVFEPRYRQMTADALDDDRLIALVLLRPGWEEDYHKRPPVHAVACLGRVFQEQRLADGRYNLLLQGLARARVVEEVSSPKLYRVARVELLADAEPPDGGVRRDLRGRLGEGMAGWFTADPKARGQLQRLLESELTLGALADILAFALPLESEVKQHLLEEADVTRRVQRLLGLLETCAPPAAAAEEEARPPRKFPPDFSAN